MNLEHARVLLTGAAGGIGRATALALAAQGARLALVDRNAQAVEETSQFVRENRGDAFAIAADLGAEEGRLAALEQARRNLGGLDILINNAGLLHFTSFEAEQPQALETLLEVNVIAPILLTRAVLPAMLAQGRGRIVNMGSTFGTIGFPFFVSYSASKFAMRGFSQALRRELHGTGVGVTYVAPRATRTGLNSSAVYRMNEELKIGMDPPEMVGAAVVQALLHDRKDVYLGWPERLFVRLNALLPGLVDGALRKQSDTMRKYALEP